MWSQTQKYLMCILAWSLEIDRHYMLSWFLNHLYCVQMPYCILIDGLVKCGKIQEAKTLFNEMKEKGVKSGMRYTG